ncbi:MAG: hypothetical protein K6G33_00080 [Ruminococcus sp.]|uniref:hypothetical protein n=1 Tax=Ruminococcus sp. TaxID=41978 RepID=UPI0025F232D0|nr:hypothetical protein [Ruminococcus sp.]MCR5599129.1 hypothetical protein [Ruminococcus sp.]
MRTIFIGFESNHGTFKSKDTGEDVYYSNRNLRFITDTAAKDNIKGFSYFEEKKMKAQQIIDILHIPVTPTMTNDDVDKLIDNSLSALINKEVTTQFAPIGSEWKLTWFSEVKHETK